MQQNKYSLRGWPLRDYIDFFISVGSVWGAFLLTLAFTVAAVINKISIPQQIYAIPIGFGLFSFAYLFDGLAHRSIYKNKIMAEELFVHSFMVYGSGFTVFISYILAYWFPALMLPFIIAFVFLKILYSGIDECKYHWTRYEQGNSDKIEMIAHYFQWLGNILLNVGFIYMIYWNKYDVVKQILHNYM